LTPSEPKIPDFKVSTQWFEVENELEWGRLGDCDEYFYTTPEERDSNPAKSSDLTNQEQNNGKHSEKDAS